ncbi:MAG: hypothetical protein OEV74_01475 [Cyclobacteriaceae bacterium]|nr:hypothetical protein [Cyclobacteriaceae bacterium]MDH4294921.1 hypothetical protein [Cyclobacteriaceae bacterium]MDH5249362.1 hypothetical protein [Cyclobacteriaceae bacterium]
MSSHHFVREGQEPALWIMDPISFQLVGPLLEWAPLVLVSHNALDYVLQWRIKIDVILTSSGNVGMLPKELFDQVPLEVLLYKPHESLFKKALDCLIGKNQTAVNITVDTSNDAFKQAGEFSGRLQMNLFNEKLKWSGISSGTFEKWLPAHTNLWMQESLAMQTIQFQGLKNENGKFATVVDGVVSIWSDQLFWVGEEQD